jgi:hypothetical protein
MNSNYATAAQSSLMYDSIKDKESFYDKSNVEMLFMSLMADLNGEKTKELENKMT